MFEYRIECVLGRRKLAVVAQTDEALKLLDGASARVRTPAIGSPADLSAGLVVTARTVAEGLAGWVSVPAEGPRDDN